MTDSPHFGECERCEAIKAVFETRRRIASAVTVKAWYCLECRRAVFGRDWAERVDRAAVRTP